MAAAMIDENRWPLTSLILRGFVLADEYDDEALEGGGCVGFVEGCASMIEANLSIHYYRHECNVPLGAPWPGVRFNAYAQPEWASGWP